MAAGGANPRPRCPGQQKGSHGHPLDTESQMEIPCLPPRCVKPPPRDRTPWLSHALASHHQSLGPPGHGSSRPWLEHPGLPAGPEKEYELATASRILQGSWANACGAHS